VGYLSLVVSLLHGGVAVAQISEPKALYADIPAGPVAPALEDFSLQTNLEVVYLSDVITNQKTEGALAGLEAKDALTHLLDGSGLSFDLLTARVARITTERTPRDDLEEVVVMASLVRALPPIPEATVEESRSMDAENALIEQQILRANLLYGQATLDQYVQGVADRLLATVGTHAGSIRVRIIKSANADAFALSNGSIYLTTGLIVALDDESQLAAVLGHELTHYTNAHGLRELRKEKHEEAAERATRFLQAVLLSALVVQGAVHNPTQPATPVTNPISYERASPERRADLWTRPSVNIYPRDLEREADDGGIRRMILAGYDASGALAALHRLSAGASAERTSQLSLYMSRAELEERIANCRQLLAGSFRSSLGSGENRHAEYQAQLGELPLDQVAMLLESGALDRAEAIIDSEITVRDSARAEFLKGEVARNRVPQTDATVARALAAYERAVTLPGAPVAAYRQAGLLHRLRGESGAAVLALQSYLERAPTAVDAALVRIYVDELRASVSPAGATP
jgi:Zn-dependent protease with chaperone function